MSLAWTCILSYWINKLLLYKMEFVLLHSVIYVPKNILLYRKWFKWNKNKKDKNKKININSEVPPCWTQSRNSRFQHYWNLHLDPAETSSYPPLQSHHSQSRTNHQHLRSFHHRDLSGFRTACHGPLRLRHPQCHVDKCRVQYLHLPVARRIRPLLLRLVRDPSAE